MNQINDNWKYPKMGDVCDFIGGSQPPKKDFISEEKTGYVRLIQIRDYKSDKNKTYIPQEKARRFCTKEDIMIGRYGPPLFQILRGLEGAYNVALMKALPKDTQILDREYLYYFLRNEKLFNYVVFNSERTAGQDGVKKELLEKYIIPLPPIAEQRRIASILDKADEIRRKRQEAIKLTEELGRLLFLDMFGDPVTNPKGWEKCCIKDIANVKTGKTPSRKEADNYGGSIRWVKTTEVIDSVIEDTEEHLTEKGASQMTIFPEKSIVIAMYGQGQLETGFLLRKLQNGEILSMPSSRAMPNIGANCHELRINDQDKTWRIVYFIDQDAIVILDVFEKKTNKTPEKIKKLCQKRLKEYQNI